MNDNLLTGDFVSPILCDRLAKLGLSQKTSFQWRVNSTATSCQLITQHFDVDGYYSYSQKIICQANGDRILPAYTIKGIERCLPPYLLTRHENSEYEMSLMAGWCDKTFTGFRLPDLLATILEELLAMGKVEMHLLNQIIESAA